MTAPDLIKQAHALLALRRAETHASTAYDDATRYYQWGHYKDDGIPVEDLQPLFERLRASHDTVRLQRAEAQLAFEHAVARQEPNPRRAALLRDDLLKAARQQHLLIPPDTQPNAFDAWLRERGVLIEPKTAEPVRQRSRMRDKTR